jgi:hypothetical protein
MADSARGRKAKGKIVKTKTDWTAIDAALMLYAAGPDRHWRARAARELGISLGMVSTRCTALGIVWAGHTKKARRQGRPPVKKRRRICLRCDREFISAGVYNRICPNCRAINTGVVDPMDGTFGRRVKHGQG